MFKFLVGGQFMPMSLSPPKVAHCANNPTDKNLGGFKFNLGSKGATSTPTQSDF